MKFLGWVVRVAVCLPADTLAGFAALVVRVLWGSRFFAQRGMIGVELREGSWMHRFARARLAGWGATTLGPHFLVHRPGVEDELVLHESVHGEQMEADCLLGALLAVSAWAGGARGWWTYAALVLLPYASYLSGGLNALLRGEAFYRGNPNEEAAYDHTRTAGG